ncbi:MAG: hypothetical protein V8T46_08610 [Sutterella seckii]
MGAIIIGAAIPLLMGAWSNWVFTGCALAAFVVLGEIEDLRGALRFAPEGTGFLGRLFRQPRAYWACSSLTSALPSSSSAWRS